MQILETSDLATLTTNAVAARAGVSIGTLYQYFDSKQALLDALVERELGDLQAQILTSLTEVPGRPGDRMRRIVRAVAGSYGGRTRVHRLLMEQALTRGAGGRLSPLLKQIVALFSSSGVEVAGIGRIILGEAQAFVLAHALAGVLRALTADEAVPPVPEVEDALVQMILCYVVTIRT